MKNIWNNLYVDSLLVNKNLVRLGECINNRTKVKLKCLIDGYEWETRPDMLKYSKNGCQKCTHEVPISNQQIDNKLKVIKPNIVRISNFIKDKEKILFRCNICTNEWRTRWDTLQGKSGCPQCYKNKRKLKKEEVKKVCLDKNFQCMDIENYVNIYTKMNFQCNNNPDHVLNTSFSCFKLWVGCPICNPINKREKFVGDVIKHVFPNEKVIPHKKFIFNNRKYFVDFFIESKNIVVEYNGLQHYKPISFSKKQTKEDLENIFLKQQKRDKEVKNYCLENNYKFVEIPYSKKDWEIKNIIERSVSN